MQRTAPGDMAPHDRTRGNRSGRAAKPGGDGARDATSDAHAALTARDQPRFVAGHFGELLQGRLGPNGPLGLVTLPCAAFRVSTGLGPHCARPPPCVLDRFSKALGIALSAPPLSAAVAPGLGTGSSTAALVLLARLAGWQGSPAVLARACLAAEGATDPLMYPDPDVLLWASRTATPLARLPAPPRFEVVGGFWGAPARTDPQDLRFPDIRDLIDAWHKAPPLARMAALATESAARTTALRGPQDDPTAPLARALGALGWHRAHTGAARGLIFAPGTAPPNAASALCEAGYHGVVRFETGRP